MPREKRGRLPRKHIPYKTRCRVLLRQLGEIWPDAVIGENAGRYEAFCQDLMDHLAAHLAADRLDLDHNPALALREQVKRKGVIVRYIPDELDPEHLEYRPHAMDSERSHKIKTFVRGDHGQYSDTVLMKRARRREKAATKKRRPIGPAAKTKHRVKRKWPSQPFPKGRKIGQ